MQVAIHFKREKMRRMFDAKPAFIYTSLKTFLISSLSSQLRLFILPIQYFRQFQAHIQSVQFAFSDGW